MDLFLHFKNAIQKDNLLQKNQRLLLGVSGGVDSVVLCELCARASLQFAIAHANFGLRGPESEEDENFVRTLAERYNAEIFVKHFQIEAGLPVQETARQLRYNWFRDLLAQGFDRIVTAHHRDDNIETVVMHFFRGTGLAGLRGMLPSSKQVIRPLLGISKADILSFARQHSLAWREDSSNTTDKYTRNNFRLNILPFVKEVFPEVEQNIADNIIRLRETETIYRQAILQYKKKLVEARGSEFHIPVVKLSRMEAHRTILWEIISEFGFQSGQLDDVVHLLTAGQGKFVESTTHRIIRNRSWLIIAPKLTGHSTYILISEHETAAGFPEGLLKISRQKLQAVTAGEHVALLDEKEVVFPLILRPWKNGDYFYPLGMPKKKKLARFFIDKKLSKTEKERVWVLESGKKICWVVGQRIDHRFRLKESTTSVLKILLEPL